MVFEQLVRQRHQIQRNCGMEGRCGDRGRLRLGLRLGITEGDEFGVAEQA